MNNIKVYKTNITEYKAAESISQDINNRLVNYEISFDLEDCDNVLRVENLNGPVVEAVLKLILESYGYNIEPLPFKQRPHEKKKPETLDHTEN